VRFRGNRHDLLAHGERRAGDQLHDDACGDAADALGFAAVVGEGEFVEAGLQIFGNRYGACAKLPS
jgi:hypothetical protein